MRRTSSSGYMTQSRQLRKHRELSSICEQPAPLRSTFLFFSYTGFGTRPTWPLCLFQNVIGLKTDDEHQKHPPTSPKVATTNLARNGTVVHASHDARVSIVTLRATRMSANELLKYKTTSSIEGWLKDILSSANVHDLRFDNCAITSGGDADNYGKESKRNAR